MWNKEFRREVDFDARRDGNHPCGLEKASVDLLFLRMYAAEKFMVNARHLVSLQLGRVLR